MLGVSISKEKVKSSLALKQCHVYMSSSVCYSYFSPAIDKTQPICHAVIPLWFLILIFLFDSTVVTKENLQLKKKSKLTTASMSNENENLSLMSFLNAQWLTCNWDMS